MKKSILLMAAFSFRLTAQDPSEPLPIATGTRYHDTAEGLLYRWQVAEGAPPYCKITVTEQRKIRETKVELFITYELNRMREYKTVNITFSSTDVGDVVVPSCERIVGVGAASVKRR